MRVLVELHGSIDHFLFGVGELLEHPMVAGNQSQRCFLQAILQRCPRYRRTFNRIGSASQLIHNHQRTFSHMGEHIRDLLHVAAEGGELLLNGLLIADIGEHIIENRQGAALLCRNIAAKLIEQCKQSDRLDGDGLASRIRPADNHRLDL